MHYHVPARTGTSCLICARFESFESTGLADVARPPVCSASTAFLPAVLWACSELDSEARKFWHSAAFCTSGAGAVAYWVIRRHRGIHLLANVHWYCLGCS